MCIAGQKKPGSKPQNTRVKLHYIHIPDVQIAARRLDVSLPEFMEVVRSFARVLTYKYAGNARTAFFKFMILLLRLPPKALFKEEIIRRLDTPLQEITRDEIIDGPWVQTWISCKGYYLGLFTQDRRSCWHAYLTMIEYSVHVTHFTHASFPIASATSKMKKLLRDFYYGRAREAATFLEMGCGRFMSLGFTMASQPSNNEYFFGRFAALFHEQVSVENEIQRTKDCEAKLLQSRCDFQTKLQKTSSGLFVAASNVKWE